MHHIKQLIEILPTDDNWHTWWNKQLDQYNAINPDDFESKLQIVQEMMSSYGGMCTFNDTNYPKHIEDYKTEVYSKLKEGARDLWKMTGRESHNQEDFTRYSIGDSVNLVRGDVLFIDRMGQKHLADFVHNHDYVITDNTELDITGMPIYSINHGHSHRIARHTAINKSNS